MGRFRDAITGLFTTREHAKANPHTTVRETRRPPASVDVEPDTPMLSGEERRRVASHLHRRCDMLIRRFETENYGSVVFRVTVRPGVVVKMVIETVGEPDGV